MPAAAVELADLLRELVSVKDIGVALGHLRELCSLFNDSACRFGDEPVKIDLGAGNEGNPRLTKFRKLAPDTSAAIAAVEAATWPEELAERDAVIEQFHRRKRRTKAQMAEARAAALT